jgi:DNA transposition AAA+ family ATPase
MKEKVKKNESNSIREALSKFIEQNGYSINRISRQIGSKGYSSAVISQYLSGKYPGDVRKLEAEVRNFLEREEEKKKRGKREIPFVETTAARRIFSALRMAHIEGEIILIYGPAGLGKTTALRNYSELHGDAIFIEADLSYTTKSLLGQIAKRLGGEEYGSVNYLFNNCVAKLKESGRIIIIDEAEHLPVRALDLLRRINDLAGVGIALAGLPRLLYNLKGRRGENAYLYSRVGAAVNIGAMERQDVKAIVRTYFPNSNGIWEDFAKYSEGNARKLSKLLYRTDSLAKDEEPQHKLVKLANSMLEF